jgi:hypothetical protein
MSKIVQAVNSMILNKKRISEVIRHEAEYFFLYKGKYKWSMTSDDKGNHYYLFYYPGTQSLEELASMADYQWESFNAFIRYSTKDIGTKEALDSFRELYEIVKGRIYKMDDVLDEIISDDTPV